MTRSQYRTSAISGASNTTSPGSNHWASTEWISPVRSVSVPCEPSCFNLLLPPTGKWYPKAQLAPDKKQVPAWALTALIPQQREGGLEGRVCAQATAFAFRSLRRQASSWSALSRSLTPSSRPSIVLYSYYCNYRVKVIAPPPLTGFVCFSQRARSWTFCWSLMSARDRENLVRLLV